ncbi:MAG: FN3 associated domain-containing protein, partial [Calditrichaceae bacterium]
MSRIDSDGYLQESLTGQYDGMYCRTVGAMVPLLLETKNYDNAKLLLKFVFKVMKMYKMNRVPHVIGQKVIHTGNTERDSIYIIGKTDQIDGQAHNILAWAQLALKRGRTSFEDSTWNFVAGLMDRSTEEPYMDSDKKGFIPDLIHNFNFEHSRPLPTNYDLLTQCFTGSALEAMIQVAKRRNDNEKIKLWSKRLNILKAGIGKYLTRELNGRGIYLELLSKDGQSNKPFSGFSWVNLSPIAAQWEPLNHKVLVNTVDEMRKQMMQQWNNITWMPTENWPNGDFSGQMIGKGIGWEIEYAREEKDWEWINQILYMLEVIQRNESIYMENSFLTTGSNHSIEYLNQKELKRMYNGVWKIVDPGNGEQAAWWCWAIAKLRKELGLSAIPEKLCPTPEIKISNQSKFTADIEITSSPGTLIYYSFDGSEPSNNSIRYSHPVSVAKPAIIKAVAYGKNNVVSN